ncbi:hypothetical protein BDN71DRAFT_1442502 [Pleurotus eryngii]|uniref:DUF6534 domain-containing protein n=1 Tax=Pleurotus eryngii TaxID=5323 RepID=A0A9P6DJ93_PLEER|nr:hypothetical protein BDN71DRAFT_1442502 [Pleurotus eryngii]
MGNPAEIAHSYMLIGLYLNIWLYGIMTTQVYLYYMEYPKDKWWIKCLVATLLLADTLNALFICIYVYKSLITNFNNPAFLADPDWIIATDPALTGIIAAIVQLFFSWRIKVLTSNNGIFVVIVVCALVDLAGALSTTVEATKSVSFEESRRFKWAVIVWLCSEAFGDLVITGTLVTFLRNKKTGFPSTDKLVDRINRMTMQTGLTTSVCAILDIIFFLRYPNGLHLIFNFALSKLYTNSFMTTLNSRKGWRLATTQTSMPFEDVICLAAPVCSPFVRILPSNGIACF